MLHTYKPKYTQTNHRPTPQQRASHGKSEKSGTKEARDRLFGLQATFFPHEGSRDEDEKKEEITESQGLLLRGWR